MALPCTDEGLPIFFRRKHLLYHDVVVVGGGFAGMRAALSAKAAGANVGLISKVHPMRSHSSGSHSGINASLKPHDSWEVHLQDTLKAGEYLNNQDAVEILCKEAKTEIATLENFGMVFSRDEHGFIDVTNFSGSSIPRTAFSGDSLGHILLQVLYERIVKEQIVTYDEWMVSSILVDNGSCRGVVAREFKTGDLHIVSGKTVILATGNLGKLYQFSTCSLTGTGDGQALAYRAGASLVDMEFIQYAPTAIKRRGILITEMARAMGGYLLNKNGDRFLKSYSPDLMELAPRHIINQAIFQEISEGRGEGDSVFLDMRHLNREMFSDQLRETEYLLRDLEDLNPEKDLIPVQPAMHRPIGGIQTDTKGATTVPGLFAVGECSNNGSHGAGRLGGNSLLDNMVFGRLAGEAAAGYISCDSSKIELDRVFGKEQDKFGELFNRDSTDELPGMLRRELSNIMDVHVGYRRDKLGLENALKLITELAARTKKLGISNKNAQFNMEPQMLLELEFMMQLARVMVRSALSREESRGDHNRTDYPYTDNSNWLKHTVVTQVNGEDKLHYTEVVSTRWKEMEVENGSHS